MYIYIYECMYIYIYVCMCHIYIYLCMYVSWVVIGMAGEVKILSHQENRFPDSSVAIQWDFL